MNISNEAIRQRIREKLIRADMRMESKAADDAKKLGLDYQRFGRWGKNGVTTHVTVNGKLVPKDKADKIDKKSTSVPTAKKSAANPAKQTNKPATSTSKSNKPSDPNQDIGPDSKVTAAPAAVAKALSTGDNQYVVKHKDAERQLPGMIKKLYQENPNASIGIETTADGFSLHVKPIEPGEPKKLTVDVGPLSIDPTEGTATLNNEPLVLSKLETKLLTYLAGNQNRVVDRGTLLSKVWGAAPDIQTRTVDMHIARLKKRLGSAANMIQNVRGAGYRIAPLKTNPSI